MLCFARDLLAQGLISSYAAAHDSGFFEVSPEACGWFDVICLQGAALKCRWFERTLMKYQPFLIDVDQIGPFLAAPALEHNNTAYQSLVHATVVSAPVGSILVELEELYGLELSSCSQVFAAPQEQGNALNSQELYQCLLRVRMEEALPACRIRFF